jgi:hypothetical protein
VAANQGKQVPDDGPDGRSQCQHHAEFGQGVGEQGGERPQLEQQGAGQQQKEQGQPDQSAILPQQLAQLAQRVGPGELVAAGEAQFLHGRFRHVIAQWASRERQVGVFQQIDRVAPDRHPVVAAAAEGELVRPSRRIGLDGEAQHIGLVVPQLARGQRLGGQLVALGVGEGEGETAVFVRGGVFVAGQQQFQFNAGRCVGR